MVNLLDVKLFQLPATFLAGLQNGMPGHPHRPAAPANQSSDDPFAPGIELVSSTGTTFSQVLFEELPKCRYLPFFPHNLLYSIIHSASSLETPLGLSGFSAV